MKLLNVFLITLLISIGTLVSCCQSTPETPSVEPPASTEEPTTPETPTPAQPENPMPVLEVAWEEVKLPPLEFGFDDIIGFSVEDEGNTISVYRCIGPADNGKATSYSLWRSVDAGRTWEEVEQGTVYPEERERLKSSEGLSGGGGYPTPLRTEEEVIKYQLNPTEGLFAGLISKDSDDNRNVFVAAEYFPFDDSLFPKQKLYRVYRLLLSTNGEQSWQQLNFPSCFTRFDRYPETPELTLLSDTIGINKGVTVNQMPGIKMIDVISSEDGSINLYMISGRGGFLRVIIKSPN